ncbi:MAG: ATP-dependent DNA helicase RecG [Gammaproteobacteria bacterium]|nr:ATP-dependent DNA helicase RecG [Gammaproteobacteria bacterium]
MTASSKQPGDLTALTSLKGVGPRMVEKLARLNLQRVQDLLFHLPLRYEDRTRIVAIGGLHHSDRAVIEGVVEHSAISFSRSGRQRRRILMVHLADGTGAIKLRFFNFSKAQQEKLSKGKRLRCYGEVRRVTNHLEMIHPEFSEILAQAEAEAVEKQTLTAIYPATEGVHQLTLKNLIDQALALLNAKDSNFLIDYLTADDLINIPAANAIDLKSAINFIHRPPPEVQVAQLEQGQHPSQQRLAFEELLAHQLSLQQLRQKIQSQAGEALSDGAELLQAYIKQLPFELTTAQKKVIEAVQKDIAQPRPMLRLVQGDVGSGKTVVAFAACLMAVKSGRQAAVMAPTEILAEQHYQNFSLWAEQLGLTIAWLSGKTKIKQRREMLQIIKNGAANIVVGTHALFQDEVEFKHLSMVVIDEQHRFGVHQRLALKNKGVSAHQLIMTATPIPRTLAMTAYGDLDVSVIDELPPGRTPIKTVVLPEVRRPDVIQRVAAAIAEGSQVYWVCTLVEESEVLQCQAAEETQLLLQQQMPAFSIGLVHGRMKSAEKESVMQQFKNKEINLLVATTVIEVGVDVPNASLMIIENAERLGLSQLHQLRGRVGRGSAASSCVLIYSQPLSKTAKKRLAVMRETNSGFDIAEEDLKIRGPGEVLGTKQTGMMQFRIADILRDEALIPVVHQAAEKIVKQFPDLAEPIIRRWLSGAEQYGEV